MGYTHNLNGDNEAERSDFRYHLNRFLERFGKNIHLPSGEVVKVKRAVVRETIINTFYRNGFKELVRYDIGFLKEDGSFWTPWEISENPLIHLEEGSGIFGFDYNNGKGTIYCHLSK